MTNNTNIGVKKSAFTAKTTIPSNSYLDFVVNGQNFRIKDSDFYNALGVTGSIVTNSDGTATAVLDKQGAVNVIRNIKGGFGVTTTLDGNNSVEVSTSFSFDQTGAVLVDDPSSSSPTYKSLVQGSGVMITEATDTIIFDFDSTITDGLQTQIDDIDVSLDSISRTGVVGDSDFAVTKINDTTIEIASGTGQIVDNGIATRFTMSSSSQVDVGSDSFFASGKCFVSIAPYVAGDVNRVPDAGNDFVGIKVIGTEATIFWTRYLPVSRGIIYTESNRRAITLSKVFYIGTTLFKSGRPWSYKDLGNPDAENMRGNPGYDHVVTYDGVATEFNMADDAFALRRAVAAVGDETFVTPQTDDIFLGIHKDFTKTTRGVPIRFHLFNLLDSSLQSNDYIPNVDILPGGTYEQWWRYRDDTFTQTPSTSLTPTLNPTTDWVFITFCYFAGSGNPIAIWGDKNIANGNADSAQISLPYIRVNDRTKDITPLFTLFVKCVNVATFDLIPAAERIILPPPKYIIAQ